MTLPQAAASIRPRRYQEGVASPQSSSSAGDGGRPEVDVSISVRTILLVAAVVAIALALVSIAEVILVIFVSTFSIAVFSPVVDAMEQRLRWSRGLCATVLVVGILIILSAVLLVLVQAMSDAVRGFSADLPRIVDEIRQGDVGSAIDDESGALDTLKEHASDITSGVSTAAGGVTDIGVSALGVITLFFSVHLPDALRADGRKAHAGLDREPDVHGQAGPLHAGG